MRRRWSHWMLRWLLLGMFAILVTVGGWQRLTPATTATTTPLFEEAWKTVRDNFYDPNLNGVDWNAVRSHYQPIFGQAQTQAEAAAVINDMLAELHTSHTHLYTPEEPAYYQLLGIFQPSMRDLPAAARQLFPNGRFEYTGIGIFTQTIDGKVFISGVLDGRPGAIAGLQVGDEIVAVENTSFHPIQSFAGKAGQAVKMQVRRTPNTLIEVSVTPQVLDTTTLFLEAQQDSISIIEQDNKRIGYVHIWSNAADPHQQTLLNELMSGKLHDADALVLDLRDGWGGGDLDYLNFFTGKGLTILNRGRDRDPFTYATYWNKPAVMLINAGSRSSKEILAYGFQQERVGPLVGAATAGAVVAGRPFLMQDGTLLYVAVADVLINQSERLEGRGVRPDVEVIASIPYAQGADLQKERAIATAIQAIQ
ncbi:MULTISPECIES: S41 family peptidase [unclassified Leptolyngbya]|uniref:S41 family peptidase n=1 Tax=unclassified Leptolyngbya TaxID=2650499 RepID=UPI001683CF9B|nr:MULTISPECIES: S41 family peptidase [unclassified Leptolyngbya]MBD1909088.1 peptidase S41 [Leptolyngbya sp. FACHB-8]MBD2157001.1 peptidase S41 [Leptolyngbya sp. FACHB-16]